MKNRVWLKSALRLVVALGVCVGLTVGVSAGSSVAAPNEPAMSEQVAPGTDATPQAIPAPGPSGFQVVWQCFTPSGATVGLPKSPQSACLAACAAPNFCQRCVFRNNAVDCDL